jgi:HSP20 family protein
MISPRNPSIWMWAEAVEKLDRAERLHRRFFDFGGAAEPAWEPPIDVFETAEGLFIDVALPGVDPAQVEVTFGSDGLRIVAERPASPIAQRARVHRLELPFGRMARRIPLPAGRYELVENDLANGCLRLVLRKRG